MRGKLRQYVHWPLIATYATLALVAAVIIGALAGHHEVVWRAGNLRAQPFDVHIVWPVFADAPTGPDGRPQTWLPPGERAKLLALVQDTVRENPLDDESMRACAQALEATGWVRQVTRIQRHPGHAGGPPLVTVQAQWRPYYAVVREIGADRLISPRGELLPMTYAPGATSLPVIFGASQPAPASPGQEWIGGDVQAGLRTLALLTTAPDVFRQVVGVDVARHTIDRTIVIVTTSGARVVWGAAPGDFAPTQVSPQEKLRRLVMLRNSREHQRRIDAGQTAIDISGLRGITTDQSAGIATILPEPSSQATPTGEPSAAPVAPMPPPPRDMARAS
jgi:hypothetical protein